MPPRQRRAGPPGHTLSSLPSLPSPPATLVGPSERRAPPASPAGFIPTPPVPSSTPTSRRSAPAPSAAPLARAAPPGPGAHWGRRAALTGPRPRAPSPLAPQRPARPRGTTPPHCGQSRASEGRAKPRLAVPPLPPASRGCDRPGRRLVPPPQRSGRRSPRAARAGLRPRPRLRAAPRRREAAVQDASAPPDRAGPIAAVRKAGIIKVAGNQTAFWARSSVAGKHQGSVLAAEAELLALLFQGEPAGFPRRSSLAPTPRSRQGRAGQAAATPVRHIKHLHCSGHWIFALISRSSRRHQAPRFIAMHWQSLRVLKTVK
nr:translation initiation factor IF-2-like [Taeniopygia guttata]